MKKRSKDDKFSSTEVGTLIEQFRGEFKVFGERQQSIIQKLDLTYEQVGINTEKLGALETAVKTNTEKIGALETAVKTNTEKIGALETAIRELTDKVEKNTEAIAELTKSINALVKTKADHEELQALDKRISVLETKVASLSR